jgi:hypothetical protein
LGFLAAGIALRHILLGSFARLGGARGHYFLYDAASAHIAFAILFFTSLNSSIETKSKIVLGYGIYLIGTFMTRIEDYMRMKHKGNWNFIVGMIISVLNIVIFQIGFSALYGY